MKFDNILNQDLSNLCEPMRQDSNRYEFNSSQSLSTEETKSVVTLSVCELTIDSSTEANKAPDRTDGQLHRHFWLEDEK